MRSLARTIQESLQSYEKRKEFSEDDIVMINKYQQWSRSANKDLFDGITPKLAKDLDKVFKKSKQTVSPSQKLFRGVSKHRYSELIKQDGEVIEYLAFLSTSIEEQRAKQFGGIHSNVISIKLKRKHAVLYLSDEKDYFDEKEVVLPRGLSFRVSIDKNKITLIEE